MFKNLSLFFASLLCLTMVSTGSCQKNFSPSGAASHNDTLRTYTNPLGGITGIGDPYILKSGASYYLYATSSPNGFKVWQSDNLIDWQLKGLALDKYAPGNNWGTGNFWAPEVKERAGKFYMTYSALLPTDRMKIRIAVSDSPLGPFINYSEPFLADDDFSYIDGDLLIDGDRTWLFFSKDCSHNIVEGHHTSQIWVAELSRDLKSMITAPVLAVTPDQSWESALGDWRWNEGPFVMKHDNLYYLMYSANVYNKADYSVGYATATQPMGPWTKYAGNPVLKKEMAQKISGPGHNSVTTSPDGKELFIVYHTHTFPDKPSGNRNLCIDRMAFDNGILKVIGPTRSPQPLPGGVSFRIVAK